MKHGIMYSPGLIASRFGFPNLSGAIPKFLATFLSKIGAEANLVPDAHFAALALERGLTLCSTDGDFS